MVGKGGDHPQPITNSIARKCPRGHFFAMITMIGCMPRVRFSYAVESVVRFPRDIEHTSIGQLTVVLTNPLGTSVTLHNRTGSITDDIIGNYDGNLPVDGPGSLSNFLGQPVQGDWSGGWLRPNSVPDTTG